MQKGISASWISALTELMDGKLESISAAVEETFR